MSNSDSLPCPCCGGIMKTIITLTPRQAEALLYAIEVYEYAVATGECSDIAEQGTTEIKELLKMPSLNQKDDSVQSIATRKPATRARLIAKKR